jgi:glycosyltransferase involved in cell wall biosynthesis
MIAALRIKNEARWIQRCLDSMRGLASPVYVFDDHSADETVAICEAAGCVVIESPFDGLDEARDKDHLLRVLYDAGHLNEWVLMIDGDEAVAPGSAEKILAACGSGRTLAYSPRVRYLWDTEDQIRVDGVYGRFARPSVFWLTPNLTFRQTNGGTNFHCSNVPGQLIHVEQRIDADLLHYGYLHREDRVRKWEWYVRKDPGNPVEDGYRHIVIGDVFPADSHFAHAGPLRLEALNAA